MWWSSRKSCANQSCRWISCWSFSFFIKANLSWAIRIQSVSYSTTDLFVPDLQRMRSTFVSFLEMALIVNPVFFFFFLLSSSFVIKHPNLTHCPSSDVLQLEMLKQDDRGGEESVNQSSVSEKTVSILTPPDPLWSSFSSASTFLGLSLSWLVNHLLIFLSKCLAVTWQIITGQAGWL